MRIVARGSVTVQPCSRDDLRLLPASHLSAGPTKVCDGLFVAETMRARAVLLLCVAIARAHDIDGQPDEEDAKAEMQYGVDISYPIHHGLESGTFQWDRWHTSMEHCAKKYSKGSCDANERSRMQLNRVQPPLQKNYTELGYAKLRAPENAYRRLKTFFDQFRNNEQEEAWPAGNTYTNHWDVPTYMISLEDQRLRGGLALKTQIWNEVQTILEEWTGQKGRPRSTASACTRRARCSSRRPAAAHRRPSSTSTRTSAVAGRGRPWRQRAQRDDGARRHRAVRVAHRRARPTGAAQGCVRESTARPPSPR